MLLTSSQVSIAVSSFVVFIFTSALFFSGYALQQQTLRDLRAVIKPHLAKPTPALYLPPQFRDEQLGLVPPAAVGITGEERPSGTTKDGASEKSGDRKDDSTAKAHEEDEVERKGRRRGSSPKKQSQTVEKKMETIPLIAAEAALEEILTEAVSVDSKAAKEEKPLSRAARRKKIKEEILAAGEGEGFKGYKRRMW